MEVPSFLRMGSWIGGDRDGNPFVTADVTRQTLAMQSERAMRFYLEELHQLGGELSLDGRIVGVSERLAGVGRAFARPRRRAPGRTLSARHRRHVCASRRHRLGARQAGGAASSGRSSAGLRLGGRLQGRSRHHLQFAVGERLRRRWRAAACAPCAARSTSSASIWHRSTCGRIPTCTSASWPSSSRPRASATIVRSTKPGRVALLITRARQHAPALLAASQLRRGDGGRACHAGRRGRCPSPLRPARPCPTT